MSTNTADIQKREAAQVEGTERTSERRAFTPRADVYETATSIVVIADMPGVREDEVDITLEKNILTIQARPAIPDRAKHRLSYAEYDEGDFERSFALSEGVDREGIDATVKDGVLQLTLPKSKETAARRIPVKAG